VIDRGGQVLRRDRVIDDKFAEGIGGADHFADFHAAASHAGDSGAGPVIPAGRGVDLGRAAKVSDPHDERAAQ